MRVLALDVGTKRIGVAMSDELLITAQGAETIYRKDLKTDLDKIAKIVTDNGIEEVIVGLPLNMDGTHGPKAKETIGFVDGLSKVVTVPVKTWDERLTTVQAERALLEADTSRAKRKKTAD
ncbi:MAG: Holliday junction resolvase RuvX, partial [Candidatus Omnitrophica bacterium]|nr:Holliday junction resolvase RuvX [Candidatus Omnitrophota bacterium]